MEITESVVAKVLDKTLEEIVELKEQNPKAYELLKYGVMCHQLSLTEEDLLTYAKDLRKEEKKFTVA